MVEISPIEDVIADVREGKMVVMVDDENRENEGDIICASSTVTGEQIAFMMRECRGLLCVSFDSEGMERLDLRKVRSRGYSKFGTAFYDSIEASEGVSTGISAFDRARTIRAAVDEGLGAGGVVVPGHVFTLLVAVNGVLSRKGHTEASYDLSRLAGRGGSGVLCEVVGDDGKMLRLDGLKTFCAKHGLKLGTIASLVDYRKEQGL